MKELKLEEDGTRRSGAYLKSRHPGLGVPGACSKMQTLGPGDGIDACGAGDAPAWFLILLFYTHK